MKRITPPGDVAVYAPGSTSNLGPGFDVLGLAVDRGLRATWHSGDEPLRVERRGTLAAFRVEPDDDLVVRSVVQGLATWGDASGSPASADQLGGRLVLTSRIPVARGLGSSSAARVAGLLLAAAAAGADEPERDELLSMVARGEGHPDNAAPALLGGLVAVGWEDPAAGTVRARRLPVSPRVGWCYAAPAAVVRTDEARKALPATVPHGLVGATGARLAILLHGLATADGDAVAWGVRDEVHSPWRLPLVPGGGEACAAARAAGAWGATLSGSGSGIVAMGPRPVMPAVRDAMAEVFADRGDRGDAPAFVFRPDPRGGRRVPDAEAADTGVV